MSKSNSLKYNGIEKSIHENALIIKYAIDLLSDYIQRLNIVLPLPNHQIRLQNGFDPKVNPQLCALHASSHYSKRWPFSASVNRISMRQFSVTLFIIHPPKKTRQLKLLLIAQRAVKKDVSILKFQDIPILRTS